MPYIEPSKVKECWDKGAKATRRQAADFWMNSLFCADEQWVAQNSVTGGIDEIPRLDPERVRVTMNLLRPRSRGIIGRLCARPLFFQVKPRNADDEAVIGAQIATDVLHYYYEKQDWELLREDQAWVTWLGGTAVTCIEWDPTAGERIVDPETRVPLSTRDGRRALYTGDLTVQVLSIAEVALQPGTRDAERALYWVKCVALPPEEVKEMFGLPETPKPDASSMLSPVQWRLLDSRDKQNGPQQLTLVYTYYERPCRGSEGQAVTVVGDDRVEESPWPFPFTDRLNIAVTRETKVHARWFGDTVLTSARVPQMAFNQSWSSIIEHMKRCGNARTWVNQATADRVEELTDEPGEFAVFVGPEKPVVVSPPQMPSWWIHQPDRVMALIDEQLGSVEVSRGVAPRNVESGIGLSILSENANTPISSLAKEQAIAWSKIAQMALKILEAKATEPRTGYFDGLPEYELPAREFTWTGKDFAGQTHARVPLDSILPRSPAQVQAWAQAQFDRGAIDLRQYARLVQLPEQEHLIAIADPDAAKAQVENFGMSQGRIEIPEPFDDHKTHIAAHNAFRKSDRYRRLDDEIKELIDDHVNAHEQMAIDEAAKASERQAIDPALGMAATANEAPMSMPAEPPSRESANLSARPPAGQMPLPPLRRHDA